MKGRIKIGASIFQDMGVGKWPSCSAPKSNPHPDPDMIFSMKWCGKYWDCKARGFGEHPDYGNGSIFVHDINGVIPIGDVEEFDTAKKSTIAMQQQVVDGLWAKLTEETEKLDKLTRTLTQSLQETT